MGFATTLLYSILLVAAPARAVDYDKIDRKLVKEPAYQTKSPKYALLVFGPEARLRIWIVLDGETLYVDRNGNGDLTERGERFEKEGACKNVRLSDPDGTTTYVIQSVKTGYSMYTPEAQRKRAAEGIPPEMLVYIEIKGPVSYSQYCDIQELRNQPQKAMIAHFHGPLTIGPRTIKGKLPDWAVLQAGPRPSELQCVIGTMSEKHGCWVVVRTCQGNKCLFPEGIRPVAQIEFPRGNAGGTIVTRRYNLTGFCCGAQFHGAARVPDEAGLGKAKVTFSFEAWREGAVRASTTELPVVNPEERL
jgi:hypothetical protein